MLALIVNPSAGGGRAGRALAGVRDALEQRGVEYHLEPTDDLDHARELGRRAAQAGELAVAFGGDGLVGAVASALVATGGVLGVLPGGRGNDFARGLGIPLDPVSACSVLTGGVVAELDLGRVGEHTFIGIASCGFDSDANRIANETRLVRGGLVYAYGALRALIGWRSVGFTITLDGGAPRELRGYTVAAANGRSYGGGMLLAPDASLRDGQLDVVLIRSMSRLRFLAVLPTVFRGAHIRLKQVEVIRVRELWVAADRPVTLYADGDPVAELPTTVSVLPSAVRVMVPA